MKRQGVSAGLIRSLAVFAALAMPRSSLRAQVTVDVVPFAGAFLPLTDWGSIKGEPGTARPDRFRQQVGVLGGARLRFDLTDRFGWEVSAAYGSSGWTEDREGTGGAELVRKIQYTLPGTMLMGDVRALLRPRRSNLYGIIGAGVMSRGGRAWDESLWSSVSANPTVYNKHTIAGILGVGLRAPASPRFFTDVTAELHIHNDDRVKQGFAFPNTTYENKSFQSELIVTAGIPFRIVGR